MTTPRQTRLVRVPDLQTFRRAIIALADDALVVVPTRAAALMLQPSFAASGDQTRIVTRDQLYETFHSRLDDGSRRLSVFDRDSMAQAAAREALKDAGELPFQVRPGLVAEMLRFYDQLRRQGQLVVRFDELIGEALGVGDGVDRGADRLLAQTRFLTTAFRGYERRVAESGGVDEHSLRDRVIRHAASDPVRHVVVTVADWIADPAGLFVADFDLLTRVSGLERLDLVCTDAVLGSGFHQRLHDWWPGLDEVDAATIGASASATRPRLAVPSAEHAWFTYRDREEELAAVAQACSATGGPDRAAVVFKRPLPYIYLAPDTLGAAGIPYSVADELPLAAEPTAAALDLVLDVLETDFTAESLAALGASPHLQAFDNDDLRALAETGAASVRIDRLRAFLARCWKPLAPDDLFASREQTIRARIDTLLEELFAAHRTHFDPTWTSDELATTIRRWIGEETCPVDSTPQGVQLLDDQAARYGDFDRITVVGLIELEWPDRRRRSIFYPSSLLKSLGWPSEAERRAGADARFLDLIASPSSQVTLSTFTLEDETIVTRSVQLDEVPRARLSSVVRLKPDTTTSEAANTVENEWACLRESRPPADAPIFHGSIGPLPERAWSVSALETYVGCPFKFFAQHVLRLEEEPDDEEVMDPKRQGLFMHGVFEDFFREWQAAGHRGITAENLSLARDLFENVVDRAVTRLPEGEAGLERTRLLGSSAAAGLGEAVFRMEAERPVAVVERLLEYRLDGPLAVATASGRRELPIKGKADRLDLLADGTFRLIDYKLGWPPDRNRALQLPLYALRAEQQLDGYRGRSWTLGEAVYLAFKGPKRVVPLFAASAGATEVMSRAQQRAAETVDAIARGDFPPTPDDVYRCETCSFAAVCRKDYVGNV